MIVLRVFRRYFLIVAIIFVLHPGVKIVLVREVMSEMVEWVKAGLAKNRDTEVDKART